MEFGIVSAERAIKTKHSAFEIWARSEDFVRGRSLRNLEASVNYAVSPYTLSHSYECCFLRLTDFKVPGVYIGRVSIGWVF